MGGTARTFFLRFVGQTDGQHPTSAAIQEHTDVPGHNFTLDNVKILAREEKLGQEKIKEALLINRSHPALSHDRVYVGTLALLSFAS